MLDFIPDYLKAIIGTALIIFIGVQGFRLTSAGKGSGKGSGKTTKGDGESKKE